VGVDVLGEAATSFFFGTSDSNARTISPKVTLGYGRLNDRPNPSVATAVERLPS